jgi:hypothetical protein
MNAPCPPNPNFPPFPLNPVVGQRWLGWVWNGSQWVQTPASGMQVLVQKFVASGPYMPSPGLVSVQVECWGGGGGGGDVIWESVTLAQGGGGGGSGGYSRKTLPAALVAGGVVITIGAGGAAQTAGGVTSFGALCTANGGAGGAGTGAGSQGGTEAAPGIGDIAFAGSPGMNGPVETFASLTTLSTSGGMGGALIGGNRIVAVGAGAAAPGAYGWPNQGGGGGGGAINQMATNPGVQLGGIGGSGLCIVTEYCWADVVPGEDCGCAPGGARIAGGFDEC